MQNCKRTINNNLIIINNDRNVIITFLLGHLHILWFHAFISQTDCLDYSNSYHGCGLASSLISTRQAVVNVLTPQQKD